jgi:hypothetical protein
MGHWEQIGEENRTRELARRVKRINWEDVILYTVGILFNVALIAYFAAIFFG